MTDQWQYPHPFRCVIYNKSISAFKKIGKIKNYFQNSEIKKLAMVKNRCLVLVCILT